MSAAVLAKHFYSWLPKETGQVLGVDIAGRLLEVAARRIVQLGHVKLIKSDAQTLDLPPHSVDAVFSDLA